MLDYVNNLFIHNYVYGGNSDMTNIKKVLVMLSALLNYVSSKVLFDDFASDCYLDRKGTMGILDCPPLVNDPQFINQWTHVHRPFRIYRGWTPVDLGIIDVWIKHGYFGNGVTVVVNDDGIDVSHPELKSRLNLDISYDYCEDMADPKPRNSDEHGTKVAGIVGMKMNNEFCGVGIAPEATIGMRRVLSQKSSCPYNDGTYFTWKQEQVDITVNSYSQQFSTDIPYDIMNSLRQSARDGRNGLGTLHVFSAGNYKDEGTSCSYNMYTSNIYAIVVAAITPWGETSTYSSRCANLMVTAPSSTLNYRFMITSDIGNSCSQSFSGTSAAAPIVAGVLALTVDARPDLTWRDFHHLIAYTSSDESVMKHSKSFEKNGAGLPVSYDYGFGIINALRMVESALFFQSVPMLKKCVIPVSLDATKLTPGDYYFASVQSDGCIDTPSETVMYLEHVRLQVELSYPFWYNLEIDLISPMKTVAKMLEVETSRNRSFSSPFTWIFDSVATWSENPLGIWQIIINDNLSDPDNTEGEVHTLNLILYGTSTKPRHVHVNY